MSTGSQVARATLDWPAGTASAFVDFIRAAWRTEYSDDEADTLVRLLQRNAITYQEALKAVELLVSEGHEYPPQAPTIVRAVHEWRIIDARLRQGARIYEEPRTVVPPWMPVMHAAILMARWGEARDRSWEPFVQLARDLTVHPRELCDDEPDHDAPRARAIEAEFAAAYEKHGRPKGDAVQMVTRATRVQRPGSKGWA